MLISEQIYAMEEAAVLAATHSRPEGLSTQQAEERQRGSGANVLPTAEQESWFVRFLRLLADPMVLVLLAAAALSALVGEWLDSLVIAIVVVLNTLLSLAQEGRAAREVEALSALTAPTAVARRDGALCRIPAAQLVVGDVVLLEAGDICPADLRLLTAFDLSCDESSLTGESQPVAKQCGVLEPLFVKDKNGREKEKALPLDARSNIVFMGMPVLTGRGEGVVTAIGKNTQIGRIADLLGEHKAPPTPLQQRLAELSRVLSFAVLSICALVFLLSLTRGGDSLLQAFMLAVSLAVAAIPEGLVVVVTLVLCGGMRAMSYQRAVARQLSAVETLGSVQVICSDKTGTLTENRMSVVQHTGSNDLLCRCAALCSSVRSGMDGSLLGDPTEIALVQFARDQGFVRSELLEQQPLLAELPFDSERKRMSTLHRGADCYLQYSKGACESLLACCRSYVDEQGQVKLLTPAHKQRIMQQADEMAEQALRVLGAAYRRYADKGTDVPQPQERDLIFIGLYGLRDKPRAEVKQAVEEAAQAGIRTVMVSGDNIVTARVIAQELGILDSPAQAAEGTELAAWGDKQLNARLGQVRVFARVRPEDKLRIVRAWQQAGKVTAMTGDGVNDAPALKAADIGVGMGLGGAEVSKRAADLVLTDDNFASIVAAVREGRRIYDNIRKAVRFLLASNLAEVMAIFIASLAGAQLFLPIHLLWINLVTDCLPAIALGYEKAERNVMQRPPRPPKESLFANGMGSGVLREGMALASLTLFAYVLGWHASAGVATSMAFFTLSAGELFHAWNMRAQQDSIFRLETANPLLAGSIVLSFALSLLPLLLPALARVFSLTPLSPTQLLIATLLAFAIVPLVELEKLWQRSKKRRQLKQRGRVPVQNG